MPFDTTLRSKITDPAILAAIDEQDALLHQVTEESIGRKNKLRDVEPKHTAMLEKIKKLGFDPDGDIEEQLQAMLEESPKKKGFKSASEYEKLAKKVAEIDEWKTKADQATNALQMERAKSAFSNPLKDIFGKASDLILKVATADGMISIKEGVPGIVYDDDFVPLVTEKGKTSALDVFKKLYPDQVITKQKTGSHNVQTISTQKGESELIDRKTFDALSPMERFEYMKKNKVLAENVSE
jgi:hypothetical protein